jgi:protocatechuate 3,4-dioxygenase beta subunit
MGGVSRRQALAGFGSVSLAALLAACNDDDGGSSPSAGTTEAGTSKFDGAARCSRTAEETEGPFYFEVDRVRSDIREGRPGAELRLGVRVRDLDAGCKPIQNAVVDVWHCDATGSYSEPGETFLRGLQVTDSQGAVEFTTLYPGWYPGRTVHIHVRVYLGGNVIHTGQLFFPEAITDAVYRRAPYRRRPKRNTRNAADSIFRNGGSRSTLKLTKTTTGYAARISMGVHR